MKRASRREAYWLFSRGRQETYKLGAIVSCSEPHR